ITGGVSGIENITGSNAGDTLTGDSNANTIYGLADNDVINPAGGRNLVYGGAGTDTFNGGPAIPDNLGDLLYAKLVNLRKLIVGDINNSSFTGFVYNKSQIPFLSFSQADNLLQDVSKADIVGTF